MHLLPLWWGLSGLLRVALVGVHARGLSLWLSLPKNVGLSEVFSVSASWIVSPPLFGRWPIL